MTNDKYTEPMLDEMFREVNEKLDRILEQTTQHNGRMREFEAWQSRANGFAAAASMFLLPVLSYLVYIHFVTQ